MSSPRGGSLGRAEIRRDDAARPALERAQTGVRGDSIEPGPEQRSSFEPRTRTPGTKQRLLDDVLGVLDRSQHSIAVDLQLPPVAFGQRREGRLVAGSDCGSDGSPIARGRCGLGCHLSNL